MTAVQQLKAPAYEGVISRIPTNANGFKVSVKFKDNLYTYQSDGKEYVDNGGEGYNCGPCLRKT